MTVDLAKLIERLRVNTCRFANETEDEAAQRRIRVDLDAADLLESSAKRIAELERAIADELFLNQLGEIGYVGLRDFAAMQSRAETAERQRDEAIERVAAFLAKTYPDNANTNAFCAFIRSLNSPGGA